MALDNTLCVHVDGSGNVESIRGFHGTAKADNVASIRAVVLENQDPGKEWREKKERLGIAS